MQEGSRFGETARAALAAAALALAPQAEAQTKAGWEPKVEAAAQKMPAFARTFGDAVPPRDFPNFCAAFPNECEPSAGTERERMERKEGNEFDLLQLSEMNRTINALPQVSDSELYGVEEHWTVAGVRGGDCEDLVLRKRYELIRRGWEPKDLLLAHVLDHRRRGHLVLMARTKHGDYVLDNQNTDVSLWGVYATMHGYTFLSRQSYLDPKVWVSLQPKR